MLSLRTCLTLILDTHALIWIGSDSPRLNARARGAIESASATLFVSAVTAWEYADLRERGRIPEAAALGQLQDMLGFELLDFPAAAWPLATALPNIHRDPVDRMLVAQATAEGITLITSDSVVAGYPGPMQLV